MRFSTVFALISALFITISGCGQAPEGEAGGAGAVDEDSPEFAAIQYRQGLMHVLAYKVGTLRDMSEGTIDADDDVFVQYSADLASVSGMLLDGFDGLAGSDTSFSGSGAQPDVWANWDDFTQKASDLQAAAETVAATAAAPGFTVGPDSAEPLGPVCGGCHRTYRQR